MRLPSGCVVFSRLTAAHYAAAYLQRAHLSQRAGTTILLLHNGQPRTPYYAVQSASEIFQRSLGIPQSLARYLAATHVRRSKVVQQCIRDSDEYPTTSDQLAAFAASLEKSLSTVTPEYRPVRCRTVPRLDAALIEKTVEDILRVGTDRLLAVSMNPFRSSIYAAQGTLLLRRAIEARTKCSERSSDGATTYFALKCPTSFELAVIECSGTSESIVQYWAERLRTRLDGIDGVVFAVPPPFRDLSYHADVRDAAKRVMYEVYRRYPRAVPWRTAYVPHWFQFWPQFLLPSVPGQIKDLRQNGRHRILVVPFASFYEDFNSRTILPHLISQTNDVSLLAQDNDHVALVNSVTELVKVRLVAASQGGNVVLNSL
ncbi:Protein K07G5.6 [Aphelenchoides avenae]|nr:Protein K07G5.6 [Aphelenchus avenae]